MLHKTLHACKARLTLRADLQQMRRNQRIGIGSLSTSEPDDNKWAMEIFCSQPVIDAPLMPECFALCLTLSLKLCNHNQPLTCIMKLRASDGSIHQHTPPRTGAWPTFCRCAADDGRCCADDTWDNCCCCCCRGCCATPAREFAGSSYCLRATPCCK